MKRLFFAVLLMAGSPALADAAAAESQFRVARRLLAEGAPQARAELQKVVDLDPEGALADDALIEQALLDGVARVPWEVGDLGGQAGRRALTSLNRVVDGLAGSDRYQEARYYRGLLLLEPLPHHDPVAARLDLLAVATSSGAPRWSDAARYAVGWLAERRGETAQARNAYQRLVVDSPESETAGAAMTGLARVYLMRRDFGSAADWAQRALDAGVKPRKPAQALRDLAVRSLLGESAVVPQGATPERVALPDPVKAPTGFVVAPDGQFLVADRKAGQVRRMDGSGAVRGSWALDDPQALLVGPGGRIFAAAGDALFRLPDGGPAVPVASLGEFAPVTAMTVDGAGQIYLIDRRGTRIGLLVPGQPRPRVFIEDRDARFGAIAWDGRFVVALDTRDRSVATLDEPVRRQPLSLARPAKIGVDLSGRVAVLDPKSGSVEILADGLELGRIDLGAAGIARASDIAFGPTGRLHILDGQNGMMTRLP